LLLPITLPFALSSRRKKGERVVFALAIFSQQGQALQDRPLYGGVPG
jgi:hypothetical protein